MSEPHDPAADAGPAAQQPTTADQRFPELAELEEEIQRRIRSNQRFLERFMDEDFADEEADGEEEPAPEDFEEL